MQCIHMHTDTTEGVQGLSSLHCHVLQCSDCRPRLQMRREGDCNNRRRVTLTGAPMKSPVVWGCDTADAPRYSDSIVLFSMIRAILCSSVHVHSRRPSQIRFNLQSPHDRPAPVTRRGDGIVFGWLQGRPRQGNQRSCTIDMAG